MDGTPLLRCAVVPVEEFTKLLRFYIHNKGDKCTHYTMSAKHKRKVDDYMETVCTVNMQAVHISQQPREVQEMAERVLQNGEAK
jgi:hypothetical protein